jgi:hypothetical protein
MKVVAKIKNRRIIVEQVGEDRNLITFKNLTTDGGATTYEVHKGGKIKITNLIISDIAMFTLHAALGKMLKNLNNVE